MAQHEVATTAAAMSEDQRRESIGWMSIVAIAVVFPTLFFLCVWFPIWMGWTETY